MAVRCSFAYYSAGKSACVGVGDECRSNEVPSICCRFICWSFPFVCLTQIVCCCWRCCQLYYCYCLSDESPNCGWPFVVILPPIVAADDGPCPGQGKAEHSGMQPKITVACHSVPRETKHAAVVHVIVCQRDNNYKIDR